MSNSSGGISETAKVRGGCVAGRVLVVDDVRINRELSRAILANHGLIVATAKNGREAVSLLSSQKFDLVLMDINMPVMNGMEAARIVRGELGIDHGTMPILAFTAHALRSEMKAIYESGLDDYLIKPVPPTVLCDIVDRWLHGTEMDELLNTRGRPNNDILDTSVLDAVDDYLGSEAADRFCQEMEEVFPTLRLAACNEGDPESDIVCREALDGAASLAGNLGFLKLSGLCRTFIEGGPDSEKVSKAESCSTLLEVFGETLRAYGKYRQQGGSGTDGR